MNINNDKRVTIIVPTYNNKKTITRCLNSILKQSYSNIHIIVVNDGSTDGTKAILEKYSNNKKITVINQKNKGVSAARNRGLELVDAEFVAFVDADDFVDTNYISNLLSGYTGDIDLSITGVRNIEDINKNTHSESNYKTGIFNNIETVDYIISDNGPKGYLYNKLWRMKIIKKYSLKLDESISMAEDLLFSVSYLIHSRKILIKNNCDYNYFWQETGLSSKMAIKKHDNYHNACSSYIKVYEDIIHMIPSNYSEVMINAKANLALAYIVYIRQINLNEPKEKTKLMELKNEAWQLRNNVKQSNIISRKDKILYYLTLKTSFLVKLRDSIING